MTAPEQARDQGMAVAEWAADPRNILMVDRLITEASAAGEPFSANDIRDRLPKIGRGLAGSRVNAARCRGEIVAVGEVRSNLPSTHAKKIAVWVGAEHVAAAS